MSKEFARKCNFKIRQNDISIKTADNKISKAYGVIEEVRVSIHNRIHTLDFVVLDHKDHDLLRLSKVGLFPAFNKLVFPRNTRSVGQEDEEEEYLLNVLATEVYDETDVDFDVEWADSLEDEEKVELKPKMKLSEVVLKKFVRVMNKSRDVFAFKTTEIGTCKFDDLSLKFDDLILKFDVLVLKFDVLIL